MSSLCVSIDFNNSTPQDSPIVDTFSANSLY